MFTNYAVSGKSTKEIIEVNDDSANEAPVPLPEEDTPVATPDIEMIDIPDGEVPDNEEEDMPNGVPERKLLENQEGVVLDVDVPDVMLANEVVQLPEGTPVPEDRVVPERMLVVEETVVPEKTPVAEDTVVPEKTSAAEEIVVLERMPVAEDKAVPERTPVAEDTVVPDVVLVNQVAPDDSLPPPVIPSSSTMPPPIIPEVNLVPPTLNTSQEDPPAPPTLLQVPLPTPTSNIPAIRRSRSTSPALDASQLRCSLRLTSPAPGSKRPASDPIEEPAPKKKKQD